MQIFYVVKHGAAGLNFLVRSAEFEYNQSAQMDKHEYRQRLDRQLMQNKWE